jgi:hypothetical protein
VTFQPSQPFAVGGSGVTQDSLPSTNSSWRPASASSLKP